MNGARGGALPLNLVNESLVNHELLWSHPLWLVFVHVLLVDLPLDILQVILGLSLPLIFHLLGRHLEVSHVFIDHLRVSLIVCPLKFLLIVLGLHLHVEVGLGLELPHLLILLLPLLILRLFLQLLFELQLVLLNVIDDAALVIEQTASVVSSTGKARTVHLLFDRLNAAFILNSVFLGLVALLLEQGVQHVFALPWIASVRLLFSAVNKGLLLYLIVVVLHHALFGLLFVLSLPSLLLCQVPFLLLEAVEIVSFLLSRDVLGLSLLVDLLVADYLLLDDALAEGLFLLLFLPSHHLFLPPDCLEVLKVILFLFDLGNLVSLHLLLELLSHLHLVLSLPILHCLLLLLKLLHVMHNDLGPVVVRLWGLSRVLKQGGGALVGRPASIGGGAVRLVGKLLLTGSDKTVRASGIGSIIEVV